MDRYPLLAGGLARRVTLFAALLVTLATSRAPAADARTGEALYKQECARCHGPDGQGTKKAPRPLIGDKSLAQVTKAIERTMPDDNPGEFIGDEAKKVATFIYDKFYSPDAQARANPPRVELAHLTVRQYRNSVADLIGSFRASTKPDPRQGLRGEYFNSRNFQNDKRLIDRIDPSVSFDFGTNGPEVKDGKGEFKPEQFCARWEGSVTAPESGTYDFVVRTEHALRLFVNDLQKPIIDGMVKSGNDTEYRASITLIAGRAYPIRLEFSKGRQLGDTSKTKSPGPVKASVALLWKIPHRELEVIPGRALSPAKAPEVAVMETPFPPDDRSYGWERGTAVSKEWTQATADAAMEAAGYIGTRLNELAGAADPKDREAKLRKFAATFTERAFRRPLTDADKKKYIEKQFEAAKGDADLATKRVVLAVLTSPRFLYPDANDGPEAYQVATRLAYTLWDSSPDNVLLEAAGQGKLKSREQVAQQAERMLADPRAKAKLREALLNWLRANESGEMAKDTKRFPDFDAAIASDLRTSLELFLDDVAWSDMSDFRQFLVSDETYLNGRLARFYGADLPSDAPFTKVKLDAGQRAGVLTHPYMLSSLAYAAESSPVHRGVFVVRGLLGIALKPPANASFTPFEASAHPNLTTRERVALQTKPASCTGCHALINPLGFTLENFDAVGRHRDKENARPIDLSGFYETRSGDTVKFNGPREMAKFLASSEDVHAAFTQQMFQNYVKQPVRAFGLKKPAELREAFARSGYSVRKLAVEIATVAAMGPPEKTARAGAE